VTLACVGAGAGLGAGTALACAGAGVPAGFGFVRAGPAVGAGFAFAVALGFLADFGFSGVPVGAGVAVAPCVAQDCHGQVKHIALAGSVRSINADSAKGTVIFAFIEPLPFTEVSQARAKFSANRGSPLKTKESSKKPNRLSRRHSWRSISGRITSTDDNLRLRHAYRVDELIESRCV
jgi:hypothetical protein